jgi:hypothetical protein
MKRKNENEYKEHFYDKNRERKECLNEQSTKSSK